MKRLNDASHGPFRRVSSHADSSKSHSNFQFRGGRGFTVSGASRIDASAPASTASKPASQIYPATVPRALGSSPARGRAQCSPGRRRSLMVDGNRTSLNDRARGGPCRSLAIGTTESSPAPIARCAGSAATLAPTCPDPMMSIFMIVSSLAVFRRSRCRRSTRHQSPARHYPTRRIRAAGAPLRGSHRNPGGYAPGAELA
jgi:hypothetical protein